MNYQPAIHFNNVNFSANDHKILKQVTGSFPEGSITTLVGPSGAGKTTLLKLCNGLLSADSGDIYIHGKPIDTYSPPVLRRLVGLALQSAPMIPGTVWENLALPRTLKQEKLDQKEAQTALNKVGLPEDLLKRNTKDLSGGQRQKVSIARTLMNRPEILLLDEITSSLDQTSRQEIEDLIVKVNKNGTTIVWITHNLQQALEIGTFTWVLMDGEIIETGDSALLKSPTNERVQKFVKGEGK
ncbi:phosphate ABC transporter ATP-binding protein [Chungangia koreensis]|uniref:Phosphate ABC transporter ATP-binding protein n=1 Tax=Chungangia koreensis TaxID=752657 RepID=A0ABV8X428_9LACT